MSGEAGGISLVALGASAGGIEALQTFFAHVPPGTGLAYVVILHLSPEHESRLSEVLQQSTHLPVRRVLDEVALEPEMVYVISPNTSLRVIDGRLIVSEIQRVEERRAPVDIFFRTLADAYGSRAACVVLSGTGPNGSSGLKRVKEYGGLAIAQDPDDARHEDMPRNAIATGLVDYVLPAAQIPARILRYSQQRPEAPESSVPADPNAAESARQRILQVLRLRTGEDFSHYKVATVLRRIERRQNLHGFPDIASYARFIHQHPDEAVALGQELLISVTNFFRDAEAFTALETRVVPTLLQRKRPMEQVRVWSVGCATGEEAYSVAMLLAEAASALPTPPGVQIFASDLDERAITFARNGQYTDADLADVSPERMRRFFTRVPGGCQIRRDLREMVLFAHHNALKDPPFSHLDLVICRNLLIYLTRAAQEHLLRTFSFALNPGGVLFLGSSEAVDSAADLFGVIDKSSRLYESRAPGSRLPQLSAPPLSPIALVRPVHGPPAGTRPEPPSAGELHLQLVEEFAPPSVVATDDHQIVHVSPRAAKYLEVPAGEPSRELLKQIRPELRTELRTAMHQALSDRSSIEVRDLAIDLSGEVRFITLRVKPVFQDGEPPRGYFLVLFEEQSQRQAQSSVELVTRVERDAVLQLEEELTRLRAQLHSTIDAYERQGEEARAATEELHASNEELRSAAEELETSKEELQSVNEELTTVNQELKIKVEELTATNNDFQNLINSTEIGTIFLDRALRVKFSTPRARDVFNLLPLDTGRPLTDITNNLRYDFLQRDVEEVLERLQPVVREVETGTGRWYLMQIVPYRTSDERIEGVVITFQDISVRRDAQQQVLREEERHRLLVDSVEDYAIFTTDSSGYVNSWNRGAQRMFGYHEQEILGRPADMLYTAEDRAEGVPGRELATARETGRASDERWHVRKDGSRLYCSGVMTALASGEKGFAKIARDLTPQRQAATELQEVQRDLERRVRERTQQLEAEVAERAAAEERVLRLVRRLVTAQEDERKRIARDIHDQFGQQLTTLRLSIERAAKSPARSTAELADALRTVGEIDRELDFLAWELRPTALDDLGLVDAVSRFLESWSAHYQISSQFHSRGLDGNRLPSEVETIYYRVAQEALNNVAKHAHASRVDLILERRDGAVTMVIEDDGVGFDPADSEAAARGLGVLGMRERAALAECELHIESTPGEGTAVFLRRKPDAAGEV